jgi:hypothetical protein
MDIDAGDALSLCARVDALDQDGVKLPAAVVMKLPSVDLGHGWCTEALRVKYGNDADVRLLEAAPPRKRGAEPQGGAEKKQETG